MNPSDGIIHAFSLEEIGQFILESLLKLFRLFKLNFRWFSLKVFGISYSS